MKKILICIITLFCAHSYAQTVNSDTLYLKGACIEQVRVPLVKHWSLYLDASASQKDFVPYEVFTPEFEKAREKVLKEIHPGVFMQFPNPTESHEITYRVNAGVSYYHNRWRYSLEGGFSTAKQNYYHYTVANASLLAGYDFLPAERYELFLEAGPEFYATFNNFKYHWTGVDGRTLEPIPGEEFSLDLGTHNSYNFAAQAKLSFGYNVHNYFWLGCFVQTRYVATTRNFAPNNEFDAGIQLRWTKSNKPYKHRERIYLDELPICEADTVLITNNFRDTVTVEHYNEVIVPIKVEDGIGRKLLFEYDSSYLTDLAEKKISEALQYFTDEIYVIATSSPAGGQKYNYELSERRANAVKNYINKISPRTKVHLEWIPYTLEEAPESRCAYLRGESMRLVNGVSVMDIESK